MVGCAFCGASVEGLPHKCKFCGKIHCSKHIIPEDHNCTSLNKKRNFFNASNHRTFKTNKKQRAFYTSPKTSYQQREDYHPKEMYYPSEGKFNLHFKNPFCGLFSFNLSDEIKSNLSMLVLALIIGLGLNYVYYQNLSLYYLFVGGIRDWFAVLQGFLNYGMGGGYDIFYLIINGIFYFYLYSTSTRFVYSVITNLHKKGTWWFLIGLAILIFVIFKYFSNIIY